MGCGATKVQAAEPVAPSAGVELGGSDDLDSLDCQWGRYQVHHIVGHGSAGAVVRGSSLDTGDIVALKKYKPNVGSSPAQRPGLPAHADNELKVLKAIRHPNVVEYIDSFRMGSGVVMVQEYLPGGDLLERITTRGPLAEADAALVMRQVLTGLSYLHKQNICHRDLKPENLLLMSGDPKSVGYWKVKLADFGLSSTCAKGYDNIMTSLHGTPEFAAPEMLKNTVACTTRYSCKIDIWGAGCVLYTMLCGARPFEREGNWAVMVNKVMKGNVDMSAKVWQIISHEAQYAVRSLLEVDPEIRPTAKQAMGLSWLKSLRWMECHQRWRMTEEFGMNNKSGGDNVQAYPNGSVKRVNSWVAAEEDLKHSSNVHHIGFGYLTPERLPSFDVQDFNTR